MNVIRIAAVTSRWLVLGVCLAAYGCDDAAELPPEVEAIVREREAAEQRALEEAAKRRQERRERPPTFPAGDSAGDTAGDTANSSGAEGSAGPNIAATDDDGIGDRGAINVDAGSRDDVTSQDDAAAIELPPRPTPPPPPRNQAAALKWAQMKSGMTMATVEALLGPATRTADDFFLTYWYYGEGRDAGKVAFIRVSRMTMAWDPPLH
ncbi:MAG: hypothetical protein WD875_00650 [Pirellulales bacterium]